MQWILVQCSGFAHDTLREIRSGNIRFHGPCSMVSCRLEIRINLRFNIQKIISKIICISCKNRPISRYCLLVQQKVIECIQKVQIVFFVFLALLVEGSYFRTYSAIFFHAMINVQSSRLRARNTQNQCALDQGSRSLLLPYFVADYLF